ncbi:potassium channel subfamily T member 1-like [Halichondria panicea]|uniref:potassium channel subfamily T member 1-like n=1 Tax=Halichondria panicea TaxID=6063 RepID=UPI00312B70E1
MDLDDNWDTQSGIAQEDEDDPFPGTSEEGPHFRIRDVFTSHHSDSGYDHGVPVDVTHYIQDKSLRHRLVLLSLSNSKLGIRMLLLRAIFMLLGCLLYVAETVYYDYFTANGAGLYQESLNTTDTLEIIAVQARAVVLLTEDKPYVLWALQVLVSLVNLCNALSVLYVTSGVTWQSALRTLSPSIALTLVLPLLYLLTLFYPPILRNLFIPSFFYCFPARLCFSTAILQALQRSTQSRPSTFRLKMITLTSMFLCFLFTWTCILHHFFRIDAQHTLFETYYFVMVTMSTVGYGDIVPRHWTGQFLVTIFVLSALLFLIPQLQAVYEAFTLQQTLHNTVSFKDRGRGHILICSQALRPLVLRDFLTEFYSDLANYDVHCVVMVEKELSSISQMYLRHPVWAKRITVLIGSPLKSSDLARARAHVSLSCFIHTPRDKGDGIEADHHSIMCAWAIKDFAPKVKLYVQILHPDNRLHLADVANSVVCEGELRSALLASNSICPGISTLVTLLLHTFKPEQRRLSSEEYQLYAKCAPCEIYDSQLGDSKYFHHFEGKNFLYTAVVAFRKYNVTLLGVRSHGTGELLLNPSLEYIMHQDDICYYIGFTREEYSKVGGATSINHALQGTCAKLAIYSMISAGIDPYTLNERAAVDVHASNETLNSDSSIDGDPVTFFITEASEPSLNTEQQKTTLETRRGLHLFKYLSDIEPTAIPVVKINIASSDTNLQHSTGDNSSVSSHGYHMTHEPVAMETSHHPHAFHKQVSEPHFKSHFRLSHDQRRLSHDHGLLKPALPIIRERSVSESSGLPLLKRSHSDMSVAVDQVLYSSELELVNSTSRLNRVPEVPPTHPQRFHFPHFHHLGRSSSRTSMASLREEVVELDLADINEEAELEELEDGLCDEASSEGRSPSPNPLHHHDNRPKYWKGQVPNTPYFGFETQKCHLVHEKRCHDDLAAGIGDLERGLSIVYSPRVSDDLYHFILPLRAANLPSSSLKPLVVMVNSQLPPEFLDTIAWLPLVYYLRGHVSDVNHWLRAGITLADSAVILRDPVLHNSDNDEHYADSSHIMAVQKLTNLFPHVSIVTELHYRYNFRFMRFTDCDHHFMGNFKSLLRKGDHLTYLFVPQFAGGRVFCPSMLDTLLYQAHVKPYIVELMRQLLGCKAEEDSGYLWHVPLTPDLLCLETYERVFQRLVSQHRYIPLGIHRTIPEGHCVYLKCDVMSSGEPEAMGERVASFLNARMEALGLSDLPTAQSKAVNSQSFVLPNPPPKTKLKPNDIILVIHPAHHHSHPPPHSPDHTPQTTPTTATPTKQQQFSPTKDNNCMHISVPIECHVKV